MPTRLASDRDAPTDLWHLRLGSAQVPPMRPGAVSWDPEGGRPDPFLRLLVNGRRVYETEVIDDTFEPAWNAALPANVRIPPGAVLRIELWDRDELTSDPLGIWTGHGLPPQALPDADARLSFESGAMLEFKVLHPQPHRGVGIGEYEVRGDALVVIRVEADSPAGRAGLQAGDAILAIGGDSVSSLGEARAATALSLAQARDSRLRVRARDGSVRDVELDPGYVWLAL